MDTAFVKTRFPLRFITAASLFDGHDASINVIRRLLQEAGSEVIHLGHNRAVQEIVTAALQEDADGIAVSSYQGGHMEFFKYMKDLLVRAGAASVKIFAGGGGTIVPREIEELQTAGIDRVFSPEDGRKLGLLGMINVMLKVTEQGRNSTPPPARLSLAKKLSLVERGRDDGSSPMLESILAAAARNAKSGPPVVGITGPGGAGKSSFTDEMLRRFLGDFPAARVAILAVDPTKRRTGGALLGDRIRMNAIYDPRVFMRSLATRGSGAEISTAVQDAINVLRAEALDLILLETSGIGQGSSAVVDIADVSVYVMTPEYGAATQLEKIDMIDLAQVIVLNKFDRRGGPDALRDVRKQYRRAHKLFQDPPDAELPVFGAVSAQFHDDGVTAAYLRVLEEVSKKGFAVMRSPRAAPEPVTKIRASLVPGLRTQYLAEIASAVRTYKKWAESESAKASLASALKASVEHLQGRAPSAPKELVEAANAATQALDPVAARELSGWPDLVRDYSKDALITRIRDKELVQPLVTKSLSGLKIPKIAIPKLKDPGEILRFLLLENLPGRFPFTAGVFPLKRADEDPKRMFAGEGSPTQTNRRFHYLSRSEAAKRLSTAFDSVTLYGRDPDPRPDIYGKVGESGVSICTLDDMKTLFSGFDLSDPNTSVSMTINGPAPIILAMFMNAAIDQQVDRFVAKEGRAPNDTEGKAIRAKTLSVVRGTVQADILKEDQAQNTCIFSTEFACRMMGDVQRFFIDHSVRNYYSVSISGYHIAEAGANPISQLAFTLANGFTYVEYYLSRGMKIDDFAPNLSFFFSNGLDPEYTVLGRVARRIWAIAVRELYRGNDRSQKLKYHIQTSGRSLHAQEVDFNDIRTTLQALLALQDHCNSLHTNAYDEAVTTPTEASVRRAMAIQYIITKEFGLATNENALQGSYIVETLTELVEEAVLSEFERLSERGGVLGAMETEYQRGRIQEESLYYERLKHSGELPIIGVNTFVDEHADHSGAMNALELTRCPDNVKRQRLADLAAFQASHASEAPSALRRLQEVATQGGNVFAELMQTVRVASLGQISQALFEVGGEYRRNM